MARPLRLEFAGALYHIIARGNERKVIFHDSPDYRKFLELLGDEINLRGWRCQDYCLMPNHYHLTLQTPQPNLAAGMQRLNATYSRWFNWRHSRVGHVFQGRYKSILVDRTNYLLVLCRYIALNPVRAGLVRSPGAWPWSAYAEIVGKRPRRNWLDTGWIRDHFGADTAHARAEYCRFISERSDVPAPWEEVRGQIWLGGEAFLAEMKELLRGSELAAFPKCQTKPGRPDPKTIIEEAARRYDLEPAQVMMRVNQQAFETAVLALRSEAGLTNREIGILCGLSDSRISQIRSSLAGGPGRAKAPAKRAIGQGWIRRAAPRKLKISDLTP